MKKQIANSPTIQAYPSLSRQAHDRMATFCNTLPSSLQTSLKEIGFITSNDTGIVFTWENIPNPLLALLEYQLDIVSETPRHQRIRLVIEALSDTPLQTQPLCFSTLDVTFIHDYNPLFQLHSDARLLHLYTPLETQNILSDLNQVYKKLEAHLNNPDIPDQRKSVVSDIKKTMNQILHFCETHITPPHDLDQDARDHLVSIVNELCKGKDTCAERIGDHVLVALILSRKRQQSETGDLTFTDFIMHATQLLKKSVMTQTIRDVCTSENVHWVHYAIEALPELGINTLAPNAFDTDMDADSKAAIDANIGSIKAKFLRQFNRIFTSHMVDHIRQNQVVKELAIDIISSEIRQSLTDVPTTEMEERLQEVLTSHLYDDTYEIKAKILIDLLKSQGFVTQDNPQELVFSTSDLAHMDHPEIIRYVGNHADATMSPLLWLTVIKNLIRLPNTIDTITEIMAKIPVSFMTDTQFDTLVKHALVHQNAEAIQTFVSLKSDCLTQHSYTVIEYASKDFFKALCTIDPTITKITTKDGRNLLFVAAMLSEKYFIADELSDIDFTTMLLQEDASRNSALLVMAEKNRVGFLTYTINRLTHYLGTDARVVLDHKQGREQNTVLQNAVKYRHPTSVKILLAAGVSPDPLDALGYSAAHLAAFFDTIPSLDYLKHYHPHACSLVTQVGSPLHVAVKQNHTDVVRWFVENDIALTVKNSQEELPIHLCASSGNVETFALLSQNAETLSHPNKDGYTAAQLAAKAGHIPLLQYIQIHFPDLLAEVTRHGTTLHVAIQAGQAAAITTLLSQRPSYIDTKRAFEHNTPLHLAAKEGHLSLFEQLLQAGASPDPLDSFGYSAAHLAVFFQKTHILNFLKQHYPDAFSLVTQVGSPLHVAVKQNHTDVVRWFVENDIALTVKNLHEELPIHLCASSGNVETFALLSQNAETRSHPNKDGYTAAQLAAKAGHIPLLQYIQIHFPDLLAEVTRHGTTLHVAIQAGQAAAITTLLSQRPSYIDTKWLSYESNTALHLATKHKNLALFTQLVEAGASLDVLDINGYSAAHLAAFFDIPQILSHLANHAPEKLSRSSGPGTPLEVAITREHLASIATLTASLGETHAALGLTFAITHDKNQVISWYLEQYDKQHIFLERGLEILFAATEHKKANVVKHLYQKGVDITATNNRGDTIAHIAASQDDEDILTFLQTHSPTLLKPAKGPSPYEVAVQALAKKATRILMDPKRFQTWQTWMTNKHPGNIYYATLNLRDITKNDVRHIQEYEIDCIKRKEQYQKLILFSILVLIIGTIVIASAKNYLADPKPASPTPDETSQDTFTVSAAIDFVCGLDTCFYMKKPK